MARTYNKSRYVGPPLNRTYNAKPEVEKVVKKKALEEVVKEEEAVQEENSTGKDEGKMKRKKK